MINDRRVISVADLSKVYKGGFRALDQVSLEITRGEVFGLLGPNGAGKTTLINIIAGLSKATSGSISVLGMDVVKDYREVRRAIGLVQQEINADYFFSVREIVAIQAGYFGIKNPGPAVERTLKSLNLWDKRDTSGRKLSGGMKRRVMIAKALVHDPDILFLDEPTAGVDVELRDNLWRLIGELKARGKTIILTTHYLEEAEQLADRIGLINQGRIIRVQDKASLLKEFGLAHVSLELDQAMGKLPPAAKELHGKLEGNTLTVNHLVDVDGVPTLQDLMAQLTEQNIRIKNVTFAKTSLNDIYRELINGEHRS
ncbi:MAG: ABC transporter ATP-binding protein [bacterium]|nr:ABC transporter ATP-binding protein [bacterium]